MIRAKASQASCMQDRSFWFFTLFRLFLLEEFIKILLVFDIIGFFIPVLYSLIIFKEVKKIYIFNLEGVKH